MQLEAGEANHSEIPGGCPRQGEGKMDLSKIPDLELRQKVKPLWDQRVKLDTEIERRKEEVHDAMAAAVRPLYDEIDAIDEKLNELLGEREIAGTCDETGLPIFDGDDTEETVTLRLVAA
jgi:hypothetical protein